MVKLSKDRKAKIISKYDPLVNMLRTKRLQEKAHFDFQKPSVEDEYIDKNVQEWATAFGLKFGERAVLMDITKSCIWKISDINAPDLQALHDTFILKGFTETQWSSYYNYLIAKSIEIKKLYHFCKLDTDKLIGEIRLENVIELAPVQIENIMKETTLDTVNACNSEVFVIPNERKGASILNGKLCCHMIADDLKPLIPVSLVEQSLTHGLSPLINVARTNLTVHNISPSLVSALAYVPTISYEDFTTYIKVDPNSHITVSASRVTGALDRNETAYVYKDKGINHFNEDFEHLFTGKMFSGTGDINALDYQYGLSNTIGSVDAWGTHSISVLFQNNATYAVYLEIIGVDYSSPVALMLNQVYYFKLKRVGTTVTLYIYSDSARTTLVASPSKVDASPISARYVYAIASRNQAVSRLDGTTYIENLVL